MNIKPLADRVLIEPAAAETKTVKEGTVAEGDTVTVKFDGTLEDGTKQDGMKSEGSKLTLGSGQFIDGFEAGMWRSPMIHYSEPQKVTCKDVDYLWMYKDIIVLNTKDAIAPALGGASL